MLIYGLSLRESDTKTHARVVELVDSLASGASARKGVRVRVPLRALSRSIAVLRDFSYLRKICGVEKGAGAMLLSPHDLDLFHAVPYPMVEETVYSYLVLGLYNPPVLSFSDGMGTRDEALLVVLRFYELESCTPGEFGAGCDFERQFGHRVTRKDVRDFLNAHPHGVTDYKDTFEHFLRTRYGRNGGASGTSYRPAAQPERPLTYRATPTYRPASPVQASQTASGGQPSAGRATPSYRPAPPSQSGTTSGQTSTDQPTARPTPTYRPAPPSPRPAESGSDSSTQDQQTAPVFRPTPSYRPAPPSPSSRNEGDGTKPTYRPMTDQAAPVYRPRPASSGTAAAVPFAPVCRGHAAPGAEEGEETSVLQRVLPTVIRVVCIASLLFLFLERRLTDQWLGPILLVAGIVFAKDLAERWSVERLSVCGILLLLFLSGHMLRWWVLSAILVLIFFYFH